MQGVNPPMRRELRAEVAGRGDVQSSSRVDRNARRRRDAKDGTDDAVRNFADAIVSAVGDVQAAARIDCQAGGCVQLREDRGLRPSPLNPALPLPASVERTPPGETL